MTIRPILVIPDKRLRTPVPPVLEITAEIERQVEDMFETMYDAPGIGLAAPQIGVMNRVVVVDCGERAKREGEAETKNEENQPSSKAAEQQDKDQTDALQSETKAAIDIAGEEPEEVRVPITMINPEILSVSEERSVYEEGCLSIPEYYEEVERPASCVIRYMDIKGTIVEREATGLLSTCVQHEIDHLDGKLFIDYLSRLKRERVTKKFQKLAKRAAS